MYPLQLLTGNVSLAAFMGMTTVGQLQAVEGIMATPKGIPQLASVVEDLPLTAFPPTVSGTPAPPTGTKWWCPSSSQGMPDLGQEKEALCNLPKELPYKKQKPLSKTLREAQREAFSKDSEVVKAARHTYHLTHQGMFAQEGSYDLASVFWEMAQGTILLNIEIYKVRRLGLARGD